MEGLCVVCKSPASKQCSACSSTYYCSPGHQKEDWKNHKKVCKPYLVKKNEQFGRYLVASKNLQAGTILMEELALMVGPKQESRPICLSCYRAADGSYMCSKCSLPMCNEACEKMEIHAQNECTIFRKNPVKISEFDKPHPVYECILLLRILLLKESNPGKWKKLVQMEHHNDIRKTFTQLWHRNTVNCVKFLRERYNMVQFDEDAIHTALGYIDVNAFEIKTEDPTISICGLYDQIYLMAHDCKSNTIHIITDTYQMKVRNTVPIKKGELLTTSYSYSLNGTLERRKHTKDSKFFDCNCKRCSDPTELGTNFSAIKCFKCTSGYMLPKDPLNPYSLWLCNACAHTIEIGKVLGLIERIRGEKKKAEEDPNFVQKLEEVIKNYAGKAVHPHHYLMIDIYHSLCEMYGRSKQWKINELSLEVLKRKEFLCREVLKVLDVLEPGLTRIRGILLYELHAAVYFRRKTEFEANLISMDELKPYLQEVLNLLEESYKIISFDPPQSTEGIIASSIPESIIQVKRFLN